MYCEIKVIKNTMRQLIKFNNGDLSFDIQRIKSDDLEINKIGVAIWVNILICTACIIYYQIKLT